MLKYLVSKAYTVTGLPKVIQRGIAAAVWLGLIGSGCSAFASTATTTTLAITSGGTAVTTISAGSQVTLTATVLAGSTAVKQGQVNFCDGAATHCSDIHVLGTAQLNSSGKAKITLRPAPGSFSYKAVFVGTPKTTTAYAGSTSSTASLTVTGKLPSFTTIAELGPSVGYTLTATTYGFTKAKTATAPTGTISFVDTTTGNSVLTSAALATPQAAVNWVNSYTSTLGYLPNAMVGADFNGDGYPDIAVELSNTANPVGIYLGNGTGNFNEVTKSPIIAAGIPVLAQDFNGDGIPDLVLCHGHNDSLTVLLGNGDGTFTEAPANPFGDGLGIPPVVVADFNGDGIPDLATGGAGSLSVFLANGAGAFTQVPTTSKTLILGNFATMVAGDFNGDGITDIAALDATFSETVRVYFGSGDGTFTTGPTNMVSPGGSAGAPMVMVTADFNGDGKADVAVPLWNGGVAVLLGNGDGTFQEASGSPIGLGDYTLQVGLADFNGDGVPDLMLQQESNITNAYALLGKGDGTFTVSSNPAPYLPCCGIALLMDVNGDGLTDVVNSSQYDGTASVLLTSAQQATTQVTGISVGGTSPHNVVAKYPGDTKYLASISAPTELQPPAAAPVFTPASGSIRPYMDSIKLTSSTPGATIYYLAVGAIDTGGSYVTYNGPIYGYNMGSATIHAYALAPPNYGQSATVTATFNVVGIPAAMTSPVPGSPLTGSSATFTWDTGIGGSQYSLYLGSTPGAHDIAYISAGTNTTATVTGLPTNGELLYVTLYSWMGTKWQSNAYTYVTSGKGTAGTMTSPANGSRMTGGTQAFSWTKGTGTDGYSLYVGKTAGSHEIAYVNAGRATTTSVNGLPTNGEEFYVTLNSLNGKTWLQNTYHYYASGSGTAAVMTSPANGTTLASSTVTFSWTAGTGINEYSLYIGTKPGAHDLAFVNAGSATTKTVSGLPTNGSKVYVTLYSRNGTKWLSNSYSYTAK
ncbi:Integrin like protein [Candidatus Koribacter versatilis Ellin345]|uniref:Integrin like protein n=1 Tax=Koribacter versatilis (strain Ellin345) TaxID=204669 RepID=Q1IUR0_KORVE|nr:FG-GAP-like repeat-containing protein [Candidatus Koribacter versatilis]ABF39390.1 Integrin like protein [Candidatus Koribacter versatilis Ellin345]